MTQIADSARLSHGLSTPVATRRAYGSGRGRFPGVVWLLARQALSAPLP